MNLLRALSLLTLAASAGLASAQTFSWGDNSLHQRDLPAGFVSAAQIALGYGFGIARFADGTVRGWGSDVQGKAFPPPKLRNVIQVAAGKQFAGALKSDGTLCLWGGNDFGQRDVPVGLSSVKQLSLGDRHAVALKNDGTLVAWGGNAYHQTEVPDDLTDVVQVAAGGFFTVALKADGTVRCFGDNTYFECNPPVGLSGVKAVAAGRYFGMALKTNGNVVCWGSNDKGQCTPPASAVNISQIAAGDNFALALKNDETTVIGWGDNSFGQTAPLAKVGYISQLSAGVGFSFAITQPKFWSVANEYWPGSGIMSMSIRIGASLPADAKILCSSSDDAFKLTPSVTIRKGDIGVSSGVTSKLIPSDRYIDVSAGFAGGVPTTVRLTARTVGVTLFNGRGGIEGFGGPIRVKVLLSRGINRDTPVILTNDHPELFTSPISMHLQGDSASLALTDIYCLGNVSVETPVTFTATVGNTISASKTTVVVPALELISLKTASEVPEGQIIPATVTLSGPAPLDGSIVDLKYTGTDGASTTKLEIASKSTSGVFTPTGGYWGESDFDVSVSATHNGKTITNVTHVLVPAISSLVLDAGSVKGGSSTVVTGTVELETWIRGGWVTLTSSDPLYAKVPSGFSVHSSAKGSFTITHFKVTEPHVVTITASKKGVSKSITLTINP